MKERGQQRPKAKDFFKMLADAKPVINSDSYSLPTFPELVTRLEQRKSQEAEKPNPTTLPHVELNSCPLLSQVFDLTAVEINDLRESLGLNPIEFDYNSVRLVKKGAFVKAFGPKSYGIYDPDLKMSFVKFRSRRYEDQLMMALTLSHEMIHSAMENSLKYFGLDNEGIVEFENMEILKSILPIAAGAETPEARREIEHFITELHTYRLEVKTARKAKEENPNAYNRHLKWLFCGN